MDALLPNGRFSRMDLTRMGSDLADGFGTIVCADGRH